jgi:hypothetical protein
MSAWEAQRAQLRPAPVYPHEFTCTEVDMFCAPGSKGAMMTLKKRKDKRESHSTRALLDDNPRKLKGEWFLPTLFIYSSARRAS